MTAAVPEPEQVEKKESVVLHLEVLKVIRDAQNQHGLKHSDFHRYRSYCTRKLRRIRKSLKASASGRSKSMYLKKVINQVVVDACATKKDPLRYLLIPLFCAERTWSYAMALKQEANTETRKKFHLIRKFKKALVYSSNLEQLCNDEPNQCDIRSKLESQAYNAFLHGMFYFEIEQWSRASEYLKKSQAIYSKLVDALDESENKEVYLQRVDELKPTLRYCAFNLNEKGAKDMIRNINSDDIQDEFLAKKLDELLSLEKEKDSSQISEINWLGKQIPIKNDKIRVFLLDLDEHIAPENVKATKLEKLEKKLFESKDCLQFLKENNQEKTALYCYLAYARQKLSCRRALELIKNLKNPLELIRPYEIIISSLGEINSLPLSQYFSNENEIRDLLEDNESQITAYKAFRCYQIGQSQRLEFKQSIALLHRCNQYIEQCLKSRKLDKVLREQLVELQTKADLDQFNILANNLIKEEPRDAKEAKKASNKQPLVDRLDEYDSQFTPKDKLVQFPAKYSAVPCKPLFFDLAYYELRFPSLEEETNANKQAGSGLSKLLNVKNFWSWK